MRRVRVRGYLAGHIKPYGGPTLAAGPHFNGPYILYAIKRFYHHDASLSILSLRQNEALKESAILVCWGDQWRVSAVRHPLTVRPLCVRECWSYETGKNRDPLGFWGPTKSVQVCSIWGLSAVVQMAHSEKEHIRDRKRLPLCNSKSIAWITFDAWNFPINNWTIVLNTKLQGEIAWLHGKIKTVHAWEVRNFINFI